MPNIRSAMKRMRSDAKKRASNQDTASELKTLSRKLSQTNDLTQAKEVAQALVSRYDRAVSHGVIPRGRANRRKSRIAKYLATLKKK